MTELLALVSYGGGVNSTAMLCEMVARKERAPAAILFADTGDAEDRPGEKPHTYQYVRMFSDWLMLRGYPAVTWVRKGGNGRTLEEDCRIKRMLPSIAYGFKTCSHKFKIEPQEKWANNNPECKALWAGGSRVQKLIGYHAGEAWRATVQDDAKYQYRYPLIEWDIDEDECVNVIRRAGLPIPGKSACFFCPNSSLEDIRLLAANYPSLAQRALEMEANADLTTIKGLGRRFSWSDVLRQAEMFEMPPMAEPVPPCGCIG